MNKLQNKQISQNALKEAYKIVQQDLLNNLTKMKAGEAIRLNGIGTFSKSKQTNKVSLKTSKLYGKTIQYYVIRFRSSQVLKRAIDK